MNLDPLGVVQVAGEATKSFFSTLKEQPLSLALVVMNFVLLTFLFYAGTTSASARNDTVKMIISWQERTDQLMANCVSKDVLDSVVHALQLQLQEMRKELQENGKTPTPPETPVPPSDLPKAVPNRELPVPA